MAPKQDDFALVNIMELAKGLSAIQQSVEDIREDQREIHRKVDKILENDTEKLQRIATLEACEQSHRAQHKRSFRIWLACFSLLVGGIITILAKVL